MFARIRLVGPEKALNGESLLKTGAGYQCEKANSCTRSRQSRVKGNQAQRAGQEVKKRAVYAIRILA